MLAELRRQANDAAQEALRDLVKYRLKTGEWNRYLEDRYHAAERLVDMIDAQLEDQQRRDPEAPDYFAAYVEGDLRADWGNR